MSGNNKRRQADASPCGYCGAVCEAEVRASLVLPSAWPEAGQTYHTWRCLWYDVRRKHPQDRLLLDAIHDRIFALARLMLKEAEPDHPRYREVRHVAPQEQPAGCSHSTDPMDE